MFIIKMHHMHANAKTAIKPWNYRHIYKINIQDDIDSEGKQSSTLSAMCIQKDTQLFVLRGHVYLFRHTPQNLFETLCIV